MYPVIDSLIRGEILGYHSKMNVWLTGMPNDTAGLHIFLQSIIPVYTVSKPKYSMLHILSK